MYFLYLNKHSTCLHTQIHTFTHNMRKVYVIKTIECIIRKRGEGKAKKRRMLLNYMAALRPGLRMGYVPDHLHPRPSLPCPHEHHQRYLEIVVRSPPKGSTYANRILPRS